MSMRTALATILAPVGVSPTHPREIAYVRQAELAAIEDVRRGQRQGAAQNRRANCWLTPGPIGPTRRDASDQFDAGRTILLLLEGRAGNLALTFGAPRRLRTPPRGISRREVSG